MKTDDLFDKIEVPADLESRLETLIDDLAEKEKQSKRKARQLRLWAVGVAASIILFFSAGSFFYFDRENTISLTAQTFHPDENTENACIEAQKALALVSVNFNKGLNQWIIANKEIEKSNKKLNELLRR
ncbi:hypothetical protein FACS189426_01550 [Bacteroidia bacterium]|nr:hypothetical protein FACS189426_01550 [Bacteroidia bacterium]GHT85734.1 hypothetical protein FACS18947_4850 [Bacteroidia bacterium]